MSRKPFPIDEFLAHRQIDTFTFPLHASSVGRGDDVFEVTCRDLQIMDRASLGFLPSKLQDEVWQQLKRTQAEISERQKAGQEPKNINEALANIDDQLRIADLICEYGWLDPKVTRDPAKHDPANGVTWIGNVAASDRIAYMIACNDKDSEQAKYFRSVRDESNGDVPGREGGEVVPDAAQRPAGDPAHPIDFGAAVQH